MLPTFDEGEKVLNVVDTTSKLTSGTEIVDTNLRGGELAPIQAME